MNKTNIPSYDAIVFEIEKKEEILRYVVELETQKGFIALIETLKETSNSVKCEIMDRNKTDSELRYLSGYLTGLRFFDMFKEQMADEVAIMKDSLKRYDNSIDL